MARPRVDDKDRLAVKVQSRITADEHAALQKRLKGDSASAWIRETIVARLGVPRVNR